MGPAEKGMSHSQLSMTNESLSRQLEASKDTIEKQKQQMRVLSERNSDLSSKLRSSAERLSNITLRLSSSDQELNQSTKRINHLQESLETVHAEMSRMLDELSDQAVLREIREVASEHLVQQLQRELRALRSDYKRMAEQLAQTEIELERMRRKVDKSQEFGTFVKMKRENAVLKDATEVLLTQAHTRHVEAHDDKALVAMEGDGNILPLLVNIRKRALPAIRRARNRLVQAKNAKAAAAAEIKARVTKVASVESNDFRLDTTPRKPRRLRSANERRAPHISFDLPPCSPVSRTSPTSAPTAATGTASLMSPSDVSGQDSPRQTSSPQPTTAMQSPQSQVPQSGDSEVKESINSMSAARVSFQLHFDNFDSATE